MMLVEVQESFCKGFDDVKMRTSLMIPGERTDKTGW